MLAEKINNDLKEAMKNKDSFKLGVIRMIKGAMQLAKPNPREELTDDDVIQVISKQIKMRKDAIEQFPVFAGIISQAYYSDLIQLNTLKSQLKQKQNKQKANEKSTTIIKENLTPLLTDYFALLEQDFDGNMPVQKMLKIASDLPEFDDSQLFGENKITERYSELNDELENLRNEEREILLRINNINNASGAGNSFSQMLKDLKQQTIVAKIETDEYTCPLCGQKKPLPASGIFRL